MSLTAPWLSAKMVVGCPSSITVSRMPSSPKRTRSQTASQAVSVCAIYSASDLEV